ncbi:MAG TPA: zinc-finger domain-containing protein [Candidatus Azoamicus sp. OHIO1]
MKKIELNNKIIKINISKKTLPLSCPQNGSYSWDSHPKVYLQIKNNTQVTCPYCSTIYYMTD